MSAESITRNLALLNLLWDGGELAIHRARSVSYKVHGVRLSIALAVQPSVLDSFFEKTNDLARHIGFLARCLMAFPESTQGTRFYKEPPEKTTPHLMAFQTRIKDLLGTPYNSNEDGTLIPLILDFDPDAKERWVRFHDDVEKQLSPVGRLADIRDIASKAADNVARVAALLHLYENGPEGFIDARSVASATQLVSWHLDEAKRILGPALPSARANAIKLDRYLLRAGVRQITTRELLQYGPNCLRDAATLREAVQELEKAGRVRYVEEGKRKWLEVNPRLLSLALAA